MNYTTLVADNTTQGSIKYWVNYSRLDAVEILEEAQAWIYSRLRLRQMVSVADVSITSGSSTASFPAGYLDPIHFGIPGYTNKIVLKDIEWFQSTLGFDTSANLPTGLPTVWTDFSQSIQLNTKADQAYTAKMTFFKTPDLLSASNETNWLTDKYPTLLRRVCMMFGEETLKNFEAMDRSEVRALSAISDIKIENDLSMRGMELDFNWDEH